MVLVLPHFLSPKFFRHSSPPITSLCYYCQKRIIGLTIMYEGPFKIARGADKTIQVFLNNKYELKEGDEFYETAEFIVELINEKNSKKEFDKMFGITFYSSLEFKLGKCKMEEEKCSICLEEFEIQNIEKELVQTKDTDVYSLPCSHIYHLTCLKSMIGDKKWIKCPVCACIYGRMMGDMPEGKMTVKFDKKTQCQGYAPGAIIISYKMHGCQRDGKQIPGTSRTGYLPDTPEGREVLDLLRQCFDRKLTFTVGRSVTTGLDNQIVWNGIHHKTCLSGGSANFGYPDQTYLKRVKEELAAKGIKSVQKK